MRFKRLFFIFLTVILLGVICPLPLRAQDNPTSTPDAEGMIFVIVQPDDSLWAISARAGLTIPQLLELNDLDESVVLRPGDRLIIGRVEPPATPTSDIPTPTLPPPTLTPTVARPRTAICILAYHDLSQNGQLDAGEPLRANVAFTIYNEQQVVANYITDGLSEPHCLEDLDAGNYHVTRSKMPNETLTTEGDWALTLTMGSALNLAFGSYEQAAADLEPTADANQQLSTRLAVTPQATPTIMPDASGGSGRNISLIFGLAIAAIVLLVSLAVLTYFVIHMQRAE